MASSAVSLLLSALLLPAVKGQDFSYVQPLDTVILGQYEHSEPVYPSRMLSHSKFLLDSY